MISVWPRMPPRMLLKLCATPLVKVPTVSMRRACCKRLSSRACSFSIDCRSIAFKIVSSAIRNRLSSPSAEIRQGRSMASNPSATVLPSLLTLVTQAHPPRPSARQASLFSPIGRRSTCGTWMIPSAAGPNRAASAGARRGQSGSRLTPGLHQTCCRGTAPIETK